ncbi:hypothetical protein VCRA2128O104_490007 [Vibrio crassostreae]|nr:hypothetical protein VCRA2128O104_490007 [Vibrio crassostreae]
MRIKLALQILKVLVFQVKLNIGCSGSGLLTGLFRGTHSIEGENILALTKKPQSFDWGLI